VRSFFKIGSSMETTKRAYIKYDLYAKNICGLKENKICRL
jgi:hypothetical protein